MTLETALGDLNSQSYFVWDDFLSPDEVASISLDYQKLYDEGAFSRAGTGNQSGKRNLSGGIRSDETYWLDPLALTLSQHVFWDRLEALKTRINEELFLGLWNLDGHYSRYPVDGFYHRHLDRFASSDQRTLSMVLYFNPDWHTGDGGELRIHGQGNPATQTDIAPIAGRLICFLSASVLHEVLLTHQVRLSFAGWWKRR